MIIGGRTMVGWYIWLKWTLKIKALQLYHRLRPELHQYKWRGIQECGCCGFEGVSCDICYHAIIVGEVAESYLSPDGLTVGRWYENGD